MVEPTGREGTDLASCLAAATDSGSPPARSEVRKSRTSGCQWYAFLVLLSARLRKVRLFVRALSAKSVSSAALSAICWRSPIAWSDWRSSTNCCSVGAVGVAAAAEVGSVIDIVVRY